MTDRRIFVIGDIHGSYIKLKTMLSRLDWAPGSGDQLVFLGDYIDRGPQSFEVMETVAELADKYADVIALKGNHESIFLNFITGAEKPPLFANGLAATICDYCQPGQDLPPSHLIFLRGLRLFYETDSYIFVHAGLRPGIALDEQNSQDLLWIRNEFLNSDYDFGKTVVFGHTPFKEPLVEPGKLGLDTGAVYGGPLTAAILPEMKFVFVE